MSFWNFLGGIALFNIIRNWFSGKPKYSAQQFQPVHNYACASYNPDGKDEFIDHKRYSTPYNDDLDDLETRIDELEDELADCDLMSERYDRIQSQIDRLQDRLERYEETDCFCEKWDADEALYGHWNDSSIQADNWDDDF